MPRRKGGREQIPDSDGEGSDSGHPRAADVDLIPERHIHRGPDGLIRREFAVVETVASPTKPRRAFLGLRSDTAPLEAFAPGADDVWAQEEEEAPVYDMLPKEPRALRPSVSKFVLTV